MKGISLRLAVITTIAATVLMACAGMPSSTAPVQFSGNVLVNKAGMTLYTTDRDTSPGKSTCTGQCATIWPPLMATAEDRPGFDFSIITREDGARQWAYDGKPLHLWTKDAKPGDRTGEGFAQVWHAAKQKEEVKAEGY